MDQESFRRLLESQNAGRSPGPNSRVLLLTAAAKPKNKKEAAKPAFKPRKVKGAEDAKDSKYRDRASERRHGEGNDFAHVEALLEDFQEQTKHARDLAEIEEKRKYLGGDSEHSVLVKGLDFALLEQNKARSALVTDALDDDSLEKAFQDVSTEKSKKRTRKDLLRELKEMRDAGPGRGGMEEGEGDVVRRSESAEAEARKLEEAKQKGKFKPIGFKPIDQPATEGKKKKVKADGNNDVERKKKKRKVEPVVEETQTKVAEPVTSKPPVPSPSDPEPIDDNFDIFAGAGEYDGLELGDDDDEEEDITKQQARPQLEESEDRAPKQWISVEDGPILRRKHSQPPASPRAESSSRSLTELPAAHDEDIGMDYDAPMRLIPLASSALPDIKELLQMDRAAASSYKNKKRKDKKKAEPGAADSKPSAELRAERDYKKLKAYTDKKAGK